MNIVKHLHALSQLIFGHRDRTVAPQPPEEDMSIHGPVDPVNNPFVRKLLSSWVRIGMTSFGVWLTAHGAGSPEDVHAFVGPATEIATGLIILGLGLGLESLADYRSQQKQLTGQAMPSGSTEAQVEAQIKQGNAPPVTLQKTAAPYPTASAGPLEPPFEGESLLPSDHRPGFRKHGKTVR
jgi:hypothetical protein